MKATSELVAAIHELTHSLDDTLAAPWWIVAARNSLNKVETTSPVSPQGVHHAVWLGLLRTDARTASAGK